MHKNRKQRPIDLRTVAMAYFTSELNAHDCCNKYKISASYLARILRHQAEDILSECGSTVDDNIDVVVTRAQGTSFDPDAIRKVHRYLTKAIRRERAAYRNDFTKG